jgi:hypothetical protein
MVNSLPLQARLSFGEAAMTNVPSFSFTPAEPEPARIPVQPEPEPEGPARCLATDFRKRVEHIDAEDEYESYWYTHGLQRPSPAIVSNSLHDPPPIHTEYYSGQTYQSATGNMDLPYKPGLIAPAPKKVSSLSVSLVVYYC